jgi:hypothetical protein
MPLIRKCKVCSAEFETKPFFVRNGGGIYCSKDCHYTGIKKGKNVPCFVCGKETYKSLRSLNRSKSKKFFCGKSCQTKWRNTEFIGAKHANWKNGEHAYRSVLSRNKIPKVCRLCRTKDERVLAVHHIDRDRKNNILSNLAWLCHNCHFLVHNHRVGEKLGLLK